MAYLDSLCRWGLSTLLPSSPLHPIHRDFIKKNWEYFGIFRQKGGGLANSEISLSEKTGASELLEGGGGLRISEFFWEKKNIFFCLMPPLREAIRRRWCKPGDAPQVMQSMWCNPVCAPQVMHCKWHTVGDALQVFPGRRLLISFI